MSANPNSSPDTLSASQQQMLASVQQLQDAQKELMHKYAAATDSTERQKIANEMDKNETLRTNLLSSTGAAALVQNQAVANKKEHAKDKAVLLEVANAELNAARQQMEDIQASRSGKERIIELNTYYGKRFMAQAGVMKIFIYMCIPVLILAVLANMGFLPNYIAGLLIIVSIVVGLIYIYNAIDDINRRDNMNFDEYVWEFDPSRVGSITNPDHGSKHKKKKKSNADDASGCSNGQCCAPPTKWDAKSKHCTYANDAQGENSAVKGTSSHKVGKHGGTSVANTAAPALLGDLSSTATTVTPTATTGPTTGPTATSGPPTSNLCWTNPNRVLKGQCMGGWTYDSAADTCTAPAGSVASSIKMCSPYKVSAMNAATQDGWGAFVTTCKVGGQYDSPNCV